MGAIPFDNPIVYRLVLNAHRLGDGTRLANTLHVARLDGEPTEAEFAAADAYIWTEFVDRYRTVISDEIVLDSLSWRTVVGVNHEVYEGGRGEVACTDPEKPVPPAIAMVVPLKPLEAYGKTQRNRFYTFGATQFNVDAAPPFFSAYYVSHVLLGLHRMRDNLPALGFWFAVYSVIENLAYPVFDIDIGRVMGSRLGRNYGRGRR